MSVNEDEGAKKLGEKLLSEVEVEDLNSVFKSFRELQLMRRDGTEAQDTPSISFFGIPALDAIFTNPTPPIIELVSPPLNYHSSGAGKTSLLYLVIAHAILPTSFSKIPIGGQDAAIILIDPLHHFSVPRLASIMLNILVSTSHKANKPIDASTKAMIKDTISQSLLHVHIFRPQSWSSIIATLNSLPTYLFDATRHKSMNRRIHSIILEDIDAYIWSIRSPSATPSATSVATASTHLTSSLQHLSTLLSCITILTSHSTTPSSFRPALPTSWPQDMAVTRLAVKRVDVIRFAPAISIEEAEAERSQRWDVVKKGRFECWKVGMGVREGEGFVFRVGEKGVEIEGGGDEGV